MTLYHFANFIIFAYQWLQLTLSHYPQCVTIGGEESCFVAVATDLNYVRIYSGMGIARQVFCLDGPVVSMASKGDLLIIAYHAGLGYSETESLGYVLIDVEKRKFLKKDRIPITPVGCIVIILTTLLNSVTYLCSFFLCIHPTAYITKNSHLVWIGFTDSGLPATADSKEVVRVMSQAWDYTWLPVAELEKHKGNVRRPA